MTKAHWKYCRNCGTKASLRARKCKPCGGRALWDEPTDEQIAEHVAKIERWTALMNELLNR